MSQVMLEDVGSQIVQLVQRASSGEDIVIVRDSTPVARITALPEEQPKEQPKTIRPGYGSGKDDILYMADDFDAPLEDFKDYM